MLSNINLKFVVFTYSWQETLLPDYLQEADAKGSFDVELAFSLLFKCISPGESFEAFCFK